MGNMEQPAILSASVSENDELKTCSGPLSDKRANVEEMASNDNEEAPVETMAETLRPVDRFFTQQARGDVLSPIKAKPHEDGILMESLELKLDDTYVINRKPNSECVQPESFPSDNIDLFDVNISETRAETEHIQDKVPHWRKFENSGKPIDEMSQGDTSKEITMARKRPQTEMEPAVFEVPRLSKYPHTDCPPVPEFRDDSEPLIQFSSETENVFCVSFEGSNLNESVEPMSIQETSQISTKESGEAMGETHKDILSAKLSSDNDDSEDMLRTSKESDEAVFPIPADEGNLPVPIYWFLRSLDKVFEPVVGTLLPGVPASRTVGFNTAIVCLPLLAASIYLLYL